MEPDLALMRELLPNLKNIGYVYSPGEANSVSMLNDLREQARKQGLNVVEAPAPTTAQVLTAARSLKGKADVLFTVQDNNVVAAYDSMHKAAMEMKIPLIASDTAAGSIAPTKPTEFELHLNAKFAAEQGLSFSDAIRKRATRVIE